MKSPRISVLIISIVLINGMNMGCGNEEAPPAAERCLLDGVSAFAEGTISNEDATYSLDLKRDEISGTIGSREIHVGFGTLRRSDKEDAPLRMRLFDAHSQDNLLDTLSHATADGPLVLDVFDASSPPSGSRNRTELEGFDCGIQNGTICVQIGYDSSADELLLDDDDGAYNGISGTLTVESIDNNSRRIHMTWDFQVGANQLVAQDNSTGTFEGCLNPTYSSGSDGRWNLK